MPPVRVAILGCGSMARAHAYRFSINKDAQLVALCDVSTELTQAFCGHHLADYQPQPEHFSEPGEMYARAKPDAVCIVTPHTLHFEHAVQALEAGCHVLMEKPMVTDAEQAHELARLVQASGKVFVVGYNTPCKPEFLYLRSLIRENVLGRLQLVSAWICQDWLRNTAGTWRQDPALSGGGQAYDSGAHLLNSLVWAIESDVQEVYACIDRCGSPIDINSAMTIRFANGVLAAVAIGGNTPPDEPGMTSLMFERGRVEIDGWYGRWINIYNDKGRVKYPPIQGEPGTPDDNFIDAILGRDEPRTTVRHGIIQSELMDAIYESARTGQPCRPRGREH